MIPPWWAPVVADFDSRVRRFLVSLAERGFAVRPTSGLRTRQVNASVGGDPMSQHLVGTARDLVPVNGDFATLYQQAHASNLFGWVEDESRVTKGTGAHIHVQLFVKGQLSPQLFAAVAGPPIVAGLPALRGPSFAPTWRPVFDVWNA